MLVKGGRKPPSWRSSHVRSPHVRFLVPQGGLRPGFSHGLYRTQAFPEMSGKEKHRFGAWAAGIRGCRRARVSTTTRSKGHSWLNGVQRSSCRSRSTVRWMSSCPAASRWWSSARCTSGPSGRSLRRCLVGRLPRRRGSWRSGPRPGTSCPWGRSWVRSGSAARSLVVELGFRAARSAVCQREFRIAGAGSAAGHQYGTMDGVAGRTLVDQTLIDLRGTSWWTMTWAIQK